jgi:hypothetical protein
MTTLSRRNLNKNVKSTLRKPKIRKVERGYNVGEYDGHDNAAIEEE